MVEKRRRFSDEFKREAVRLAYESGRRLSDVARELDVRPVLIRRWRRKLSGGEPGRSPTTEERDIRQLQRQLSRVREERDIQKKPWRSSRIGDGEARPGRASPRPVSGRAGVSDS